MGQAVTVAEIHIQDEKLSAANLSVHQWEMVTRVPSSAGCKALEALMKVLVELQDELLYQYPGTRHLVDGKQSKTER